MGNGYRQRDDYRATALSATQTDPMKVTVPVAECLYGLLEAAAPPVRLR